MSEKISNTLAHSYLREAYSQEWCQSNKTHQAARFLCFLIANDKPSKFIEKNLAKLDPKSINTEFGELKLSLLHIAAIKGTEVFIKLLLSKGANHTLQDVRGWTPAHHAAASGHNALLPPNDQKDFLGRSAGDLLEMQYPPDEMNTTSLFAYYKKRKQRDGTAQTFLEKTKYHYTDRTLASANGLYFQWLTPPKFLIPAQVTNEFQQTLNKKLPRLSLQRCDSLGGKYALYSEESIRRGQVIGPIHGVLVGSINEAEKIGGKYLSQTEYRGPTSFYKDGPPNCAVFPPMFSTDLLLVAYRQIDRGTPIVLSTPPTSPVKWGKYHFFDRERFISEFKRESMQQRFLNCTAERQFKSYTQFLLMQYQTNMFYYPWYTPPALLLLLFEGITSFHEIYSIFHNELFLKLVDLSSYPDYHQFLRELIIALEEVSPNRYPSLLKLLERKGAAVVYEKIRPKGAAITPFLLRFAPREPIQMLLNRDTYGDQEILRAIRFADDSLTSQIVDLLELQQDSEFMETFLTMVRNEHSLKQMLELRGVYSAHEIIEKIRELDSHEEFLPQIHADEELLAEYELTPP